MIKVAEDLILQLKELAVVLQKDDLVGNMPTEQVINFMASEKIDQN